MGTKMNWSAEAVHSEEGKRATVLDRCCVSYFLFKLAVFTQLSSLTLSPSYWFFYTGDNGGQPQVCTKTDFLWLDLQNIEKLQTAAKQIKQNKSD